MHCMVILVLMAILCASDNAPPKNVYSFLEVVVVECFWIGLILTRL